jgi:hypothetical protein
MSRRARLFLFALGLFACAPALAQQPAAKKPAPKRPAAEADPLAEARRASAISLVTALADDARAFREPHLRARTQARAADALWETDKERARELFRRAWEAAEAADREHARLTESERRQRAAAARGSGARELPSMRPEVLRLAARRDRALGEEFLAALEASRKEELANANSASGATPAATTAPAVPQRFNPDNPPPEMAQRLNLARQLIADGDVERAVQFAGPSLYPVNTLGMAFLDALRPKDAATADRLYSALLPRAAADPQTDANTVSLLSSYVLTPYLYITVQTSGGAHTRRWNSDNAPPSDLDPRLRAAFLNTAAQILLRPLAPPEQDQTSAGRKGAYVIITRLAPVFEQHGHPSAAALRARQSLLTQEVPDRAGTRPDDPIFSRGLVPEDPNRDHVQEALSRLERARDSNERDRLYFEAAMHALGRGGGTGDEARARELAGKIEDVDTRRQLLAFIAYRAVEDAIRGKRPEDALRHARSDELTRVQRAWGLTEAAGLLAKNQPGAAVEALDAAAEEARRIDENSPDRVRALVAVATQLHPLDRARAWDLMTEVAKSANALPEFSGEDGQMTVRVEFKGGGAMTTNSDVESFDLTGIFASLARDDFDRAAALARTFKGESARAVATLAVARVALEKKKESKESAAH